MILPFSKELNGKQTYFVEKILKCLWENENGEEIDNFISRVLKTSFNGKYEITRYELATCNPKLHTIRLDEKKRWQPGNKIHPVINNRIKDKMLQFAPTFFCISIQTFSIEYINNMTKEKPVQDVIVKIDNRILSFKECQVLAINDGFESLLEFTKYFNTDFKGKIIHWTNLKY